MILQTLYGYLDSVFFPKKIALVALVSDPIELSPLLLVKRSVQNFFPIIYLLGVSDCIHYFQYLILIFKTFYCQLNDCFHYCPFGLSLLSLKCYHNMMQLLSNIGHVVQDLSFFGTYC